jgi:lipid-binding SYLF domain-containing protein
MRTSIRTLALGFALAAPVALAADTSALVADARATIQAFKQKDAKLEKFFSSAVGYAVFPTIAKGGFVVGGAGGDGVLFVGGQPAGTANMGQASIGAQLGGQTYSEIIFFQNAATLNDFKKSNFTLAAQASAVALSAGAAANASYQDGVAVFTASKTGLMYEASVGGQKFTYHPFAAPK